MAYKKLTISILAFKGPFRYLANYKNPCWKEPRAGHVPTIRCVPYFYLVGAPKAGTTDLYRRLTRHPEVVMPRSKETRWFDRYRFNGQSPVWICLLLYFIYIILLFMHLSIVLIFLCSSLVPDRFLVN